MILAERRMVNKDPRIWAASYDARNDAFRVAMEDGRIELLRRPIPEDDGSEVLDLFLEGDGEVFTVIQASGNEFSVPWDAIPNLAIGGGAVGNKALGKRIGQRVKALRKVNGLTQAKLARMLGLQRPNISRLESGTHLPSILLIQRLADVFQMAISDLIAEEGRRANEKP